MIRIIIFAFLLSIPNFLFGQISPFDTLNSRASINNFLVKNFYEYYKIAEPAEAYKTPALLTLADSLKTPMWIKADLDQNGYTDLIFNRAVHLEAVLVFPGNKFLNLRLSKPGSYRSIYYYPEVIYLNKTPLVLIRKKVGEFRDFRKEKATDYNSVYTFSRPFLTDTLIYKFRGFVEYNPNAKKGNVDFINVQTKGCFGACPVFDISIKGKECILVAKSDLKNISQRGTYTGTLKNEDRKDLEGILTYINSGQLKTRFYINEDAPTAHLQYSVNNVLYEVEDNGLRGTLALEQLFKLIHEIVEKTEWKTNNR